MACYAMGVGGGHMILREMPTPDTNGEPPPEPLPDEPGPKD